MHACMHTYTPTPRASLHALKKEVFVDVIHYDQIACRLLLHRSTQKVKQNSLA